jgi:hypothetical protein
MKQYTESEARSAIAIAVNRLEGDQLARVASLVLADESVFITADGDSSCRGGVFQCGHYITEVRDRWFTE